MMKSSILIVLTCLLAVGCEKKHEPRKLPALPDNQPTRQSSTPTPPDLDQVQQHQGPQGTDYLSTVVRSKNFAQMTVALSHLRDLGQDLQQYRTTQGSYPPSLQALVDAGLTSSKRIRSTVADRELIYLPPKGQPAPGEVILFDPVNYLNGTFVTLQANGSAVKMSKQELQEHLNRQGY